MASLAATFVRELTIERLEGTVNQVLGDGIMSIFGAPIAHEDHAARAYYAALAMQTAMRDYTEEVRRKRGLELRSRIGLNSGEVVVRTIGNDLHMDYSAVGPTTHLAARMEQLAAPGSIRLSSSTLRLVEGLVQVHDLGPVPVKGMDKPDLDRRDAIQCAAWRSCPSQQNAAGTGPISPVSPAPQPHVAATATAANGPTASPKDAPVEPPPDEQITLPARVQCP